MLTKSRQLQSDIPCLSCLLKTSCKRWVLHLFFDISVEIGLLHLLFSLQPIRHSFCSGLKVTACDRLPFVTDAVNSDNAPTLHEEPEYSGIQLSHMSQFKQSVSERL